MSCRIYKEYTVNDDLNYIISFFDMRAEEVDVDTIIDKLLNAKGKECKLLESEVRGLCQNAREILLSQPMLLELEAPIKICGMDDILWKVMSMGNSQI